MEFSPLIFGFRIDISAVLILALIVVFSLIYLAKPNRPK
jgi:hypothetical protein